MKIAILGHSGSGKSTLAKALAQHYNIPVLYLDTVQFLPGWQMRERAEAKRLVAEFMQNDDWVIDGNYQSLLQKERLQAADWVVLLQFNRFLCFWRAYRRYLKNCNVSRESMADGCTEKFDREFAWWILHKGRNKKYRRHYKQVSETYKHKLVRIKNQKQLDAFLNGQTGGAQ